MLPPLLNHEINASSDAVPLPMKPLLLSALHIVEALLNEGDPLLWQPAQSPGVPGAKYAV
jgi:hypothetical protein